MTDHSPLHPIVTRVAAVWGVPADQVLAGGRHPDIERARQDAMLLMRLACDASYRRLAARFGLASHTLAKAAVQASEVRASRDLRHSARLFAVLVAIAKGKPRNAFTAEPTGAA